MSKIKLVWTLGVLVTLSGSTSAAVAAYSRAPASEAAVADEIDPQDVESELAFQGINLKATEPNSTPNLPLVEIEVFKNSANAGLKIGNQEEEFVLVSVNGIIQTAYVASTATDSMVKDPRHIELVGKLTPEFQHVKLTIPTQGESSTPFPWTKSITFEGSAMYWGLQIHGGYFIHSTPHYKPLGSPASMGCVRVDFPAAMEIWDLVVNHAKGNAYITVYGSSTGAQGRASLEAKLHESGQRLSDIQRMVDSDLADAHAVSQTMYNGLGHRRRNQSSVNWPTCGGKNCFTSFNVTEPK